MAEHNDFGKLAEEKAAEFLQKHGYRIIARNFRHLKAEVDIICDSGEEIVFVEVKARASGLVMEPHEAVTKKKMKLMVSAADHFMDSQNIKKSARFDIVSVLKKQAGHLEITHMKNAFESIDAN